VSACGKVNFTVNLKGKITEHKRALKSSIFINPQNQPILSKAFQAHWQFISRMGRPVVMCINL